MEIKGFTYGFFGKRGQYRSEEGYRSRELMFQTGINWMCLAVTIVQKQVHSTEIGFDFAWNSSDRDIMAAVQHAHEKGIKVCMKPVLNCADGVWRTLIEQLRKIYSGKLIYNTNHGHEQAAFYDSCLRVFAQEGWFAGMFWWDWGTYVYDTREEAERDNGFAIHLKKAQRVLTEWNQRL